MGRFITPDTWMGDHNRPLSLNRWVYVEGNPVNYADPSGHWIHPECQWMPTKGLYESCILLKYGLEPINQFELGKTVIGERGCYLGPSAYRAPGYLEGFEWHIGGLPSFMNGIEVVYDFATLQRSTFKFFGVAASDSVIGIGESIYFGRVSGFKSNSDIVNNYRDVSLSASVGTSLDLGIGTGIGRGYFVSKRDARLRGKTWYLGSSLSGDALEWIDLGGAILTYTPTGSSSYARLGEVNEALLYSDILSGASSPWNYFMLPSAPDFFRYSSPLSMVIGARRAYALLLAIRYVSAYKELYNENR